jgi:hypothetical protein
LVKNLALIHTTTEPSASGLGGAPVKRHFTFLAVKSGIAKVRFAEFRRWELPHVHLENIIRIKVDAVGTTEEENAMSEKEAAETAGAVDAKLLAGGWSPFVEVEGQIDISKIFDSPDIKACTTLLVTNQEVEGYTNSIFVANLSLLLGGSISKRLVLVRATQKVDKSSPLKLVNMQTPSFPVCNFSWNCVYKPADKPTDAQKDLLAEATDGLSGIGFGEQSIFAADQPELNNSTIFAGNMILSDINRTTFPVLLTVALDPGSAAPVIVGIENVFDLV